MVNKLPDEFRTFSENCSHLRPVFRDSRRSLDDVSSAKLFSDEDDLRDYSFSSASLQKLVRVINGQPAIVIFGQTCIAKANLVNAILEQDVLPTCGGAWRWVRIVHGVTCQASLIIGSEFELVEKFKSHMEPWDTIPKEDLMRPESEKQLVEPSTLLEVRIRNRLLEEKVQLIIPPDSDSFEAPRLAEILQKGLDDVIPVFLYSLAGDCLSEHNLKELQVLKKLFPLSPVFFIYLGTNGYSWGLTSSYQQPLQSLPQPLPTFRSLFITDNNNSQPWVLLAEQLVSLGYISKEDLGPDCAAEREPCSNGETHVRSELHIGIDKLQYLVSFVRFCLQAEMLNATTILNEVLSRLVRKCVLSAFDLAREIQITPIRIQYAQEKEEELYKSLVAIADENQEEISDLIEKTLEEIKESLVETACPPGSECECRHDMELEAEAQQQTDSQPKVDFLAEIDTPTELGPQEQAVSWTEEDSWTLDSRAALGSQALDSRAALDSGAALYSDTSDSWALVSGALDSGALDFQEEANSRVELDARSSDSMTEHDSRTKTEEIPRTAQDCDSCVAWRYDVDSQAEAERAIRRRVLARLSAAVAARLAQRSGTCVSERRVGTLRRCVASLELAGGPTDAGGNASGAVQKILVAAQDLDLEGGGAGDGRSLLDRVVSALRRAAGSLVPVPRRDARWRRQAAVAAMRALPPPRPLAAFARARARSSLAASHAAFQLALARLADRLAGRLEQTQDQRLAIRKLHAPRLARLLLETTCMADEITHGMPRLGREIGRGQYGVVFSCDSWAGDGPCAVKTVVPPDDKHWNDLAMEFYYTRTIPPHDRIVRLRGSVLDHSYGGGEPAVLLVMDRLKRDLYSGLRAGLEWLTRLQVAIDVVQGIRYLHSQGLVHRDIKLKNVLLDDENRAKLTDLGFCIPEAMMSGSIVGTPVHMAPELLSGHYHGSVDVYAFGILFWYICAGHVKLPYVFERFQNKEQLWVSVKKGIRPERLHQFDDRCWALMEQCWAGDPAQRPLLGNVQPLLEAINAEYKEKEQAKGPETPT